MFNADEMRISSVHTPPKIIAQKGVKQVSGVTSAERVFNTTMIACINTVVNSVPSYFVFPGVYFKKYMVHGTLPGSDGAGNPCGWSTSEIFVEFLEHLIKHVKPY